MQARTKVGLLTTSMLGTLILAAGAQDPGAPAATPTIQIEGNIKFIEVSDLAALRDGVLKQIEFRVGDLVEKGQQVAFLYDDFAQLKVQRQKITAESVGAIERATAMLKSESVQLEIKRALERARQGNVPIEEMRIKEAMVEAAKAELRAAIEAQAQAKADLALADQEVIEHTIKAPFTGYVMDRMKDPGESVQLNEAVLRLGRIDTMQFLGKLPVDQAELVKPGDLVEVQPYLKDADLAIEAIKFPGKITAIGREVDSVGIGPPRVQVWAEIENPNASSRGAGISEQLLDNMESIMTIYLRPGVTVPKNVGTIASPSARGVTAR